MLGLQLPSDPRWAVLARENLPALLTDHAYCEQKAASSAISLLVAFPEYPELVDALTAIAKEELGHFEQVHAQIRRRGWHLGRERKDPYVNDLQQFVEKSRGRQHRLMDRLLCAALIEARSCERFRLLAETLPDADLAGFYRQLMVSEAQHYTVFLGFSRQFCGREATDSRWNAWLAYEAQVIARYSEAPTMHG